MLTTIRGRIILFVRLHKRTAGYEVAREVSGRNPENPVKFPPLKAEIKRKIKELPIYYVWESEWSSTQKGKRERS